MPEIDTLFSQRESEAVQSYADQRGITKEEAVKKLALAEIQGRLNAKRKSAEVVAFKSPKRD